jgi:ubiquinone/menaquinone biosynthesis C-methylase UbiE
VAEDSRTQAARKHFDRWSKTYESDHSAHTMQKLQLQVLEKLELGPDDVVLDVACGTGVAVREAAKLARRAVGFDVSPGMIEQARGRAEGIANADFVEGDVTSGLPFEDGEFTALLCSNAFHHFANQREAIAEIARVLAPGGRIVIADANRRQPLVFALDLVLRSTQKSHVGFRSPRWIARRLRKAGLRETTIETIWKGGYAFVEAHRPGRRQLRRLGRRAPRKR